MKMTKDVIEVFNVNLSIYLFIYRTDRVHILPAMTTKRTRQNPSAVEKDASEIAPSRAAKTSKGSIMSPKSKLKWIKRNRQGQDGRSGHLNQFENGTNDDRQPAGSKRMLFEQDMNSEDINISRDVDLETEGRASLPSSYFAQKASASSKTVAELGISLANESELRAAVAKLPERLPEIKRNLFERYRRDVRKMSMEWRAGFSVLLYGYGSKFDLVKMILKESCSGYPAMLIDGLSPRLTYRSILMNILALLRDCKPNNFSSLTDEELFHGIREETANGERVFVFLSNIDGPALRNYRDQRILSEIAVIPNVHFGATIDHVNAPLIWDLQTYDRFSWAWHHTPTFKPYIREVNYSSLPSLFLGRKYAFISTCECLPCCFCECLFESTPYVLQGSMHSGECCSCVVFAIK
jgi:hypothetical protein